MSTIAPTQPPSPASLTVAGASTPDATSPELYRFTVDQYERMTELGILTVDDRVELINGIVVTKMAKGPAHVWASKSVENLLEPMLGTAWCVRREEPARIPDLNEPEPDDVVARGTRRAYLTRHPVPEEIALIVEVSDTTYHRDRYEKYPAFARSGIPIYWIVNLVQRRVEVYTDPSPEGYRSQRDYHAGDVVPVVIDGQPLGQIAVADILPPPQAEGTPAEGNGA
jgi:Uma2 family endonuclease